MDTNTTPCCFCCTQNLKKCQQMNDISTGFDFTPLKMTIPNNLTKHWSMQLLFFQFFADMCAISAKFAESC